MRNFVLSKAVIGHGVGCEAEPHPGRMLLADISNVSKRGGDSGEAERLFRRDTERHSGMNPNTIGA